MTATATYVWQPTPADRIRFWEKVSRRGGPDVCWPWMASWKDEDGYGQFRLADRVRRAHQVAWELTYGPIPEGLQVLHSCDYPPCCNPRCLFLGTQQDNIRDMVAKGRWRNGKTRGEHAAA